MQGRFFSYTLELLLWAVVTQLRDESWCSSWEELRQNTVSTWKIHQLIGERRRKAQFYRSHAVDTKQIGRKKLWGIHLTGLLQQLLCTLSAFLLYFYAAVLFQCGCFNSQKLNTKALRKDTNTMEISGKTEKKKYLEIERMEIQFSLSYKINIFIIDT